MKERVNKSNKRIIPIEIKAILIIVILLFVGLLTTYILKSYAKFEKKESYNIVNAIVGEFYKEFVYTGSVQEYTVPITGYYNIELWGASGYVGVNVLGAEYTKGTIYLEKDEVLYFYVGEAGKSNNSGCQGGWNGGGNSVLKLNSTTACGATGGGATDVRLVRASTSDNSLWNESTSLRSRIMVAGGTGFSAYAGTSNYGYGLFGTIPAVYSGHNVANYGYPGTQISGGGVPTQASSDVGTTNGTVGVFGVGGTGGRNRTAATTGGGSGGGAGYYGGSGSSGLTNGTLPSSGGSSYISGYGGVNSVQQSGGTASQPLHTNNTIHYSNKYFINGKMQTGVNNGNGKAKIRYVRGIEPDITNPKLNNVRYIKVCSNGTTTNVNNGWKELQAIHGGINVALNKYVVATQNNIGVGFEKEKLVDGSIYGNNFVLAVASGVQCATVDLCVNSDGNAISGCTSFDLDEITVWGGISNGSSDGRITKDNTLSVGPTNVSGTTSLTTVLHNYPGTSGYQETTGGRRYNAWNLTAVE